MVGHRTRLVQEDRSRTEEEEDRVLESYLERSRAFDRSSVMLSSLPRGWVLAGVLALAPAFVAGTTTASLAIAIGGVLLGLSALTSLSNGLAQLASAAVAARRLRPLLAAASRHARAGDIASIGSPALDPRGAELQVRGVGYRHEGRERAVLRDCDLVLRAGDRILLEGPSGGGKSTFGALVGGLRDPSDGVILLDGLDRHSLGAHGWRERVVLSPQFHENHVLGHSFAFNALLGSEWPPTGASLDRLSAICEELGLGPLLARMPAGLEQSVGDSGWQLSHGERARLYLARVLAQEGPGLWILDETFAALDPITRERCLDAVLARAPTLVVVSHR
jgi:ATP-binding cassette, subfamily B, bacterial